MTIEEIEKEVKEKLSPFRYDHSLRVGEEAKKLAVHYHIDEQKAYVAGILHDIAKELPEEECKQWIETYHLSKELLKEENKNIKHADIGAVIAKERYHLDDDICHAIQYHTIGNKDMDLLAKIIYIADKIGRKDIPDDLLPLKTLAYQDIDEALLYCLEKQEKKLQQRGFTMNPATKELLANLKQQ